MRAKPQSPDGDGDVDEPEREATGHPMSNVPAETPSLLQIALSSPRQRVDGIVIGRVLWRDGDLRVTFAGCPTPEGLPALAMVPVHASDEGAEVALMFQLGDPSRPCVLGKMAANAAPAPTPVTPTSLTSAPAAATAAAALGGAPLEVTRDGDRLVLRAENEIVLACGEASITLTRAGKVLVRGAYVISASTGVHRILGATVEIN